MTGTLGQGGPREKPRDPRYLGSLKIAVIIMGIMIVVGTAVVAVTIAKRLTGSAERAPAIAADAPPPFGEREIALPDGARLVSTALGDGRLALHLTLADGSDAILMLDVATGERLGLIRLTRP